MSNAERTQLLRFEIQHIFPSEIFSSGGPLALAAQRLLGDINFNLESRGNKMALFSSPEMRDAMRNAPTSVQQALIKAGFGWNTQNSYRNPQFNSNGKAAA